MSLSKQPDVPTTSFNTKKIVLMYKEKPKENYYSDQDMFVDLDQASGGYPVRSNMLLAYGFKNTSDALNYDKKGEFILAELEINGLVKINEDQDKLRSAHNSELIEKEKRRQLYEQLKKEFGTT